MKTEIKATVRCKAFSGEGVRNNKVLLDATTGEVRVWDSVAGHYTTCHALSVATQRRIAKKLLK